MIHIVLDTNIFSANRRRDSGPFRALARLCKGGKVKLHMPYLVKHEFLSQQKQQAHKLINEAWSAAGQLTGITSDPTIHKFANNTKAGAEGLKERAVVDVEMQVVAGHGRLLACELLGIGEVPTFQPRSLTRGPGPRLHDRRQPADRKPTWDDRLLAQQFKDLSLRRPRFQCRGDRLRDGEIDCGSKRSNRQGRRRRIR